jgi:hypothetical protein
MARLKHNNLFQTQGDRPEVYEALQQNYNTDTYIHGAWISVFFIAAIGGVVWAHHSDWIWIFMAIFAAERSLSRWIDNSNRNWAMHVIDWMERNREGDPRPW